jgi:hypothetical protein
LWEFPVDQGLVLVRSDFDGFYLLNSTARLVWHEWRQGVSVAEIAAGLAANFGIALEVARHDVEATVVSWQGGLLAPSPPSVLPPATTVEKADARPVDCVVHGTAMRVFLESGEVWDEIAPRLAPLRAEVTLSTRTFKVQSAAGRVLVFRDGACIGDEENAAGARAILLQAMATSGEPAAILHAGGCGGVLLAGHTHSGKSTLCAALMGRGVPYYCDDSAVLDRDFRLTPMPFPIMLRQGSWPLIEERFPEFGKSPVYRRWGSDIRFLTPRCAPAPATITALVFVRYEKGAGTQLAELSVFHSLLSLERSGFWVEHSPETIARFLAWLAAIPRYSLQYEELEAAEGIILDLAAHAPRT